MKYTPKRDYKVGMKLYLPYNNGFIEYEITKMVQDKYTDEDDDDVFYNNLYLNPTNPKEIDSICEDYNADEMMCVETDQAVIEWKKTTNQSAEETLIDKAIEFLWDNFYEHPHEYNFICSDSFKGMEDFIDKFKEAMEE